VKKHGREISSVYTNAKTVPLHATKELGGREAIATIHSGPWQ
jgi:hypothetical protein